MRLAVIGCLAFACSSSIGEHATRPGDDGSGSATASGSGSGSGSAIASPPVAAPTAPGQRLPTLATPRAYDLRLEVDPDRDAFRGTVEISISLAHPTDHVWLHADQLVIETARWTAGTASGALAELAIPNDDDMRAFSFGRRVEGEVRLRFEYTGKVATDEPEGLFRQKAGGKWYLYAQSESVFARRIVPCFDEPRWKPRWKVALVVPRGLVALGNGAVVSDTTTGERRVVELAEIASMPSYLLAIAVGPFQLVPLGTVGRARVPARVVVPAGDAGKAGVAKLKLAAVVDALEGYLDRPLPLAKLDLVAVPKFFGAMENTGLITFEASILIGDPKSWWVPRRFIRFAAHELAHQWFGNQVTQEWWDDLWLAEGFATWLGDRTSDQLGAYNDPAMRRQLARRHALASDDEATPRPLRRPIDSAGVEERFDAIAYEKGGALLDMIEEFVGNDPFRDAIRAYVAAHDNGSVTSNDVVRALATISPDAAAVLTSYLDLGGAPVVKLDVSCTGKPAIEARASAGTVPVCVRYPEGASVVRACVAATTTRGTIYPTSCPTWVIGNAGGDGYYRIANPLLAAKAPATPSERLAYADDVAHGVVRGDVALATALGELDRMARGKDAATALGAATIAAAIDPLVDDADRARWRKWLAPRFATWARPAKGLQTAVAGELREQVWELLPAPGGGKPWFDKVVARARREPEPRQARILENLGELQADQAEAVVELALAGTFKPERVLPAIAALLERPATRTATWRALRDRLPKLIASVATADLHDLVAATGSLCDRDARAEVVAAFTTRVPADLLVRPLAAIDRCIAQRATLGDLGAALAKLP